MKTCAVEGCPGNGSKRGLCASHYMLWYRYNRYNDLAILEKNPRGTGCLDSNGYIKVMVNGKHTYEHVLLAKKALGKPLPKGAVVHHTGERHDNHGFFKLVICPSNAYHSLIHNMLIRLAHTQELDHD